MEKIQGVFWGNKNITPNEFRFDPTENHPSLRWPAAFLRMSSTWQCWRRESRQCGGWYGFRMVSWHGKIHDVFFFFDFFGWIIFHEPWSAWFFLPKKWGDEWSFRFFFWGSWRKNSEVSKWNGTTMDWNRLGENLQNRCSEGEMVGFLGANDLLGEIFSASWDRNDNSLRLIEMIHSGNLT